MVKLRTLLLLLLIALVILECESAKKKKKKKPKTCTYNGKKLKAGQVAVLLKDNCVNLMCSKKGTKMELTPVKGCSCCNTGTKPKPSKPKPSKPKPSKPKPTKPPKPTGTKKPTGPKPSTCDYSEKGSSHTMNLPPNNACEIKKSGISDDEIKLILHKHNELRQRVAKGNETKGTTGPQPGAKNMMEMRWNKQLAEVAQAWTEQCPSGHDKSDDRKICDPDHYVGQNMYKAWGYDAASKWEGSIQKWYDEVQFMPSSLVDKFGNPGNGKVIGHYTQVVWADTYEVGCGGIDFPDTLGGTNYPEAKTYVCNYGPGGNWMNDAVYEKGTPPASNCPNGPSTAYPGLCAPP